MESAKRRAKVIKDHLEPHDIDLTARESKLNHLESAPTSSATEANERAKRRRQLQAEKIRRESWQVRFRLSFLHSPVLKIRTTSPSMTLAINVICSTDTIRMV